MREEEGRQEEKGVGGKGRVGKDMKVESGKQGEKERNDKRKEEEGKMERKSEAGRNDERLGSLFSQHRKVKAVATAEAIWMSSCFSHSASRTYGE